jgi:NAD(P)-dependent dehydrogenase (short-subunit alcohol dehydrogenase family)
MQEETQQKVYIVTGAGSGIGRACAILLAKKPNKLVIVDYNDDALESLNAEILQAGNLDSDDLLPLKLSVRSAEDMTNMASETLQKFGETNLTGTFLSNQAVLSAMTQQKQGDIINISSTSGRQGRPFDGPYSASKFGIIGLSESLAEEVSALGIRVQTVLPDAVETPLWDQNGPAALKPVNTMPAERVAEFIIFLLDLPRDTYMPNPVLAPMKQRKKRRKKS